MVPLVAELAFIGPSSSLVWSPSLRSWGRLHPWFGRRVCVHGAVDKAGDIVFRCTLDGSQADRWLEVPAWMFDRTACPDPELLTAQPFVSIDALAALSALLDLALKDRTPSAALLSGASRASHDQNRGETDV